MKAIVLKEEGLQLSDYILPIISDDQAEVKIKFAALNHRDVWITKGQYAGIRFPVVLGSDGAGMSNGKKVVINPSINWYSDPIGQPSHYEIVGMPKDGTMRQVGNFNKKLLHTYPEHLEMQEAAAIPLAGLTAYRVAMKRCGVQKGDKVLVTGIGGGVALFAAQFALAAKADVWVSSGDDDKIEKAIALGMQGGENYKNIDWHKNLQQKSGGFDVIIDSAGGDGFSYLMDIANAGARIGIYGGTVGKINNISPQKIFWKQLNIFGSTMGNHQEFTEMLNFISTHKIKPVIDSIYKLEDFQEAFNKMSSGKQFGKILIEMN